MFVLTRVYCTNSINVITEFYCNILILDLARELTVLTNYQNTVVLLDDIDSISTQDYVTGTNTLVSSICNLLDYLQREGGVLVATCNHRDKVNRNLKRPGR